MYLYLPYLRSKYPLSKYLRVLRFGELARNWRVAECADLASSCCTAHALCKAHCCLWSKVSAAKLFLLVLYNDPSVPQSRRRASTRAFSWLKAPTGAFTFKTLFRHYAKRALTPRSLNVKLGLRRNYHKGRAAIRHYGNQTARPS